MSLDTKYVIIADDLTGACDAAAPFAARGHRTVVNLNAAAISSAQSDVLAYTTDSRGASPHTAAEEVRRLARSLVATHDCQLIKKIDSTLLGNVAVESCAALEESGADAALIAPAFPEMGRCILDGTLYVAGCNSHRRIADIVRQQIGAFCQTLPLPVVRRGHDALLTAIREGRSNGCRWFSVDGELEKDLSIVCDATEALGSTVLPVASGGLLRVLAGRGFDDSGPSAHSQFDGGRRSGSVVIFVGSVNPHTDRQIAQLAGVCDLLQFGVDQMTTQHVTDALGKRGVVVIRVGWHAANFEALYAVLLQCAHQNVAGVILTGGDTARLICRLAGCSYLILDGEVTAGVPRGRFGDGLLAGTPIITKAGGFGGPDALLAACNQLGSKTLTIRPRKLSRPQ